MIWGRFRDGALTLACDRALHGARLRAPTLVDLRAFSPDWELRVWRDEAGIEACLVEETLDGVSVFACAVDRVYALLGSDRARTASGEFRELRGPAGQTHASPGRAVRVRTYFARDSRSGLLREAAHRYLAVEE